MIYKLAIKICRKYKERIKNKDIWSQKRMNSK